MKESLFRKNVKSMDTDIDELIKTAMTVLTVVYVGLM